MEVISTIEEYKKAIQNSSIIIFVDKSELEMITSTNLISEIEQAIPEEKKTLTNFFLADIEELLFVCVDLEITGTPAIAAFMNGEVISCEVYGDCEDFDGWNEDELFDFSCLPNCLNEFLSDLE